MLSCLGFLFVYFCFVLMRSFHLFCVFLDFYLFIHERHRGAETQAEGEAGSMQGAGCGCPSRASRITPWAEGGAKPLTHPASLVFIKDFPCLTEHKQARGAAEGKGEAGSLLSGVRGWWAGSQDPRSMT